MSCGDVNDENHGVCLGGKQSSSFDDIFALEQPTGRPSILRQTENLPSKTVPKGVKVCFQTPRRDPVTKRIMSPTKSVKMASVDECTKAMDTLSLDKTNILPQEVTKQTDASELEGGNHPADDMPIRSKGGYQLDFDNLDALNPFQGSTKIALSPPRPAAEDPLTVQNESDCGKAENMSEEPTKTDAALDETLPFTQSVENSLADLSTDIGSTDSSVVTVLKGPDVDEQDSCPSKPEEQPANMCSSVHQDKESATFDEEAPLPPKTSYNLDFEEQPANMCSSVHQDKESATFDEEAPLPPKTSYNLDFDNLDSFNPFQTGGSKIQISPVLERKVPDKTPPAEASEMNIVAVPEAPVQSEEKPIAGVAPISTDAAKPGDDQPAVAPVKEGPIKLEFNFDDGKEVKRKPPPKKLGKRPTGPKPKEGKPASDSKPPKEAPVKPVDCDVDVVPVPKSSYSFDFEKFDDPDFNPFGTNAKMNISPKSSGKSTSAAHTPPLGSETSAPEHKDEPCEKEASSPACAGESVPVAGPKPEAIREDEDTKAARSLDQDLQPKLEQPVQSFPDLSDQKTQSSMPESNEEFVPATEFMSSDLGGQFDYLEQFGSSSFKESALRKQSLYLKFDPLLRESPKKCAGPAPQTHGPLPAVFPSRLDSAQISEKEAANGPQKDDFPLFDVTAPIVPVSQNSPLLESLVPFPQPASTEEDIIEVLKYSQMDMDAAMAKAQAEMKEKDEQWSAKYNKLSEDGEIMRKLINELELQLAKVMVDQEKEREVAQMKINEALLEKEQISTELNSMERSFSDLFKRLEKYKDVIDGYKKNEVTLKTCAQNYLAEIKMEKQRYQALKAHAEEKLNQANAEIAEVRYKFKSEAAAHQAQWRREQLKVQSLEKSLDQKVKEAEELTKLCDELIANAQKV